MDAFAGVSFGRPEALMLVAAMPAVALFLLWRERRRRERANRFATETVRGVSLPARASRPVLLSLALALAALALAAPRWGVEKRTLPRTDSSLVIVVDASLSMRARDLGVARWTAATSIARRLLERTDGRAALIVFEGLAETVAPLTHDREAILTLLESFEPGEIASPGSNIGGALLQALRVAREGGASSAEIAIFSDGEDQGGLVGHAVEEANKAGVKVSTYLFGLEEGASIELDGGELLRTERGEVVRSRANADVLKQIAEATGGRFVEEPLRAARLEPLELRASVVEGEGESTVEVEVPIERYQWPLAASFLFFLMGSLVHRGAE